MKFQFMEKRMKYKGTLLAVKDCDQALKYYHDMFGLQLLQDNDGNMELTGGLYLQEALNRKQKRSVFRCFQPAETAVLMSRKDK